MKRIFILNGHPTPKSLSQHFTQVYAETAEASGHEVRMMQISEMDFEIASYRDGIDFEPSLVEFFENVKWCEHLVLATPLWWGGMPGKLKGLIDRAFTSGNSFDPNEKKMGFPKPLLAGRTARVMINADTPYFYFRLVLGRPMEKQIQKQILGFVGIKPTKFSYFAPIVTMTPKKLLKWEKQIQEIAKMGI